MGRSDWPDRCWQHSAHSAHRIAVHLGSAARGSCEARLREPLRDRQAPYRRLLRSLLYRAADDGLRSPYCKYQGF